MYLDPEDLNIKPYVCQGWTVFGM